MTNQKPDGSWTGGYPGQVDTSFGLVFLARGAGAGDVEQAAIREHREKGEGAQRLGRAAARRGELTRWMATREEGYLQLAGREPQAPQAELHNVPILYMAGHEELKLSEPDQTKLRDFVNSGGLVLGQADCNSTAFTQSFEKLGEKLFPKYKFRAVPANSVSTRKTSARSAGGRRWRCGA